VLLPSVITSGSSPQARVSPPIVDRPVRWRASLIASAIAPEADSVNCQPGSA